MTIEGSINGHNIWIITAVVIIYMAAGAAVFSRSESFRCWWKLALRRFAPLYFLGLPALLLYFFLCGFLSVLAGTVCGMAFPGLMPPNGRGILHVYKAIEWGVGFFGMLMCAWTIQWAELPRIWLLWTASIMAIVAGYREARIDSKLEMGPKIADSFDWVDATIPFLAILVYLILRHYVAKRAMPRMIDPAGTNGQGAP